jgi:choline dehydrogenase-like flavoprotein
VSETFDYIIVGAGSAGCVLAERLSADGRARVLLLEAGGWDDDPWIKIPKGVARLVTNPDRIWAYSVTQPRFPGNDANEVWIRGRGVGGSSSINGMIWSRGEPADYDEWERLGCAGWNGAAMTAAFKALEDHDLGVSETRGVGGPVHIASAIFSYPLAERMIAAGVESGLAAVADLNGATGKRVGHYSHNIRRGRRVSSATAFLSKARRRRNVEIIVNAPTEQIRFEDGRAIGVVAKVSGVSRFFACSREVIVSCGAIESPLLLQRSGIGPAAHLVSVGVAPIVDSPDVGARMREHLALSMPHRLREDVGINRSFFGVGAAMAMARYLLRRDGVMATGPFEVGAFINVAHPDGRPDAQLYLGGYTFALSDDNHPVPLNAIDKAPGITIYGQLLRLASEGALRIAGPTLATPPRIEPNWLTVEEDRRAAVNLVRAMRHYMAQPSLAPLIASELLPGSSIVSDTDILDAFRRLATCGLHATGTCRMGRDDRAVVDQRLRVNGVRGLRVADCSVMPSPVTGNTNAPAMALALRAASLIIEDAGVSLAA